VPAVAPQLDLEYLRAPDVAARYGWTISYVRETARRRQLPHRVVPGTRSLLFPLEWLIAWEDGAELECFDLPRGGRMCRPVTLTPEMREPDTFAGPVETRAEVTDGERSR
jgi:hypothetical protein